MPLVLMPEDGPTWLWTDEWKPLALVDPSEGGDMKICEISRAVDGPSIDQSGEILAASSP